MLRESIMIIEMASMRSQCELIFVYRVRMNNINTQQMKSFLMKLKAPDRQILRGRNHQQSLFCLKLAIKKQIKIQNDNTQMKTM